MQRHHQRNHRHRQRSSPDGDVPKFYKSGLKDAVGKGDIILLRDAARLRENTRTKGQYESALKEILLEKNLMAWYEAVPLKIPSANGGVFRGDTYPPDFFTAIFVNGKQVIIELHNADNAYLKRMGRLRETYGDKFYYILIKSNLKDHRLEGIQISGETGGKMDVDEFWHMPRIYAAGRDKYNRNDCDRWKALVKERLEELVMHRADKNVDTEEALRLVGIYIEKRVALINVRRAS